MSRARITWVDHAKGVGIFLVVLGHTIGGLQSGRLITAESIYEPLNTWIYRFHMPLFFVLSGLFAERQIARSSRGFLQHKLTTIAYPYVVWSFIFTLSQFAASRYTNRKPSLLELAEILVKPIQQFWFLYALFWISVLYYVVRRCGVTPLGVLAFFTAFWSTIGWMPLGPWGAYLIRANGVYVALGSVLNARGWIERAARAPMTTLIMATAFGYGIVTASVGQHWADSPIAHLLVALCGIAASLALSILLSRTRGLDFIRILGVNSLEIYVAHTIFTASIRILLHNVLRIQNISTLVATGTVTGIVLPLVLSWLCRRYHAEFVFRLNPPNKG